MASMNPILAAKADLHQLYNKIAGNDMVLAPSLRQIEAGSKNTAPLAARFLIAEQSRSFWNKQYDEIKKEAREAGILGADEDYVEGETVVTSSFTGFDITAKKAAGSEYADTTATKNVINKYVPAGKREQALAECIKSRKGAVTIAVSIK